MMHRLLPRYHQALRWVRSGSDADQPPFTWPTGPAVAAALAFVVLAIVVAAGWTLRADGGLELAAHADATPALLALMGGLTDLGYSPVLAAIVVAADLLLLRAGRRLATVALSGGMLGEGALDNLTKLAMHRQRPQLFPHAAAHGWSFPSGHAFATFCLAALLVGLVWGRLPRPLRPALAALAALLVLGIGASRVFLGVHYPSDVVGGWLAATAWLGALSAVLRRWPPRCSAGAMPPLSRGAAPPP